MQPVPVLIVQGGRILHHLLWLLVLLVVVTVVAGLHRRLGLLVDVDLAALHPGLPPAVGLGVYTRNPGEVNNVTNKTSLT
jgi:hypothetical protein